MISGRQQLAAFPVHADAPRTGSAPAYYYLGIPKNSLRKQDAFRIISHMLEDGPQLENGLNGMAGVRRDPAMIERFGERLATLQGKRVRGVLLPTRKKARRTRPTDADMEKWGDAVLDVEFGILD